METKTTNVISMLQYLTRKYCQIYGVKVLDNDADIQFTIPSGAVVTIYNEPRSNLADRYYGEFYWKNEKGSRKFINYDGAVHLIKKLNEK